jgi:hypothetical protein
MSRTPAIEGEHLVAIRLGHRQSRVYNSRFEVGIRVQDGVQGLVLLVRVGVNEVPELAVVTQVFIHAHVSVRSDSLALPSCGEWRPDAR